MKTINGTAFVTELEVSSCFDFSVKELLPYRTYCYAQGIADITLFKDAEDIESEVDFIFGGTLHHMLDGFIELNDSLTGDCYPYESAPISEAVGFYVTEYLKVDGKTGAADELCKHEFPPGAKLDNIGFAFRFESEFWSIVETYENEYPEPPTIITYYNAETINENLKRFGLYTKGITELVSQPRTSVINTGSEPDHPPNNEQMPSRKEKNLLRTIGALSLLLMQKNSNRYGTENKPTSSVIAEDVQDLLKQLEVSAVGQSKSTLAKLIPEGVKIALEE